MLPDSCRLHLSRMRALIPVIYHLTHYLSYRTVSNVSTTRSKLGRDEIKWSELLSHFRTVQNKHEKSRRQSTGDTGDTMLPLSGFANDSAAPTGAPTVNGNVTRPGIRRRVTGGAAPEAQQARPPSRTLSPLNPTRARGSSSLGQASQLSNGTSSTAVPSSPTFNPQNQRQPKRTLSLSRKT